MREETDLLDHVADVTAQRDGVDVHDVAPIDGDGAAVGLDHPVDDAHGRGLPAAGGTDQHADLALGNDEGQPVDRRMTRFGETLGQSNDFDHDERSPGGVIARCSAPNSRSVPNASSVAGMAPTKSCGNAIIAMPAVMKSPRPPPPM